MKKRLVTLLVAAVMALSLIGCGGGDGETKPINGSSEDETDIEDTESNGEIEIDMLVHVSRSIVGESGFATGFYTALDDWIEKHPDVKVNIEEMDQTAYQTKINSLGASGDIPDVFMLKGSWTTTFVDNGWATDITEELDADSEWKDSYIAGGFDPAIKDDRIYGVPQESMTTGVIFYNSEMWKEIGYEEFPSTWDELLDAVGKFKEKGIATFVMGNKPNWPAESCWLSTLGDRFTGTDWTYSVLEGNGAKFTDDSFVKALTTFQELAEAGAFNEDINSIDDTEQNSVYFNKKAAAIIQGTWFIPTVDTTAPDDVKSATKLAILPAVDGGSDDQNTVSGGAAWFLSMGTNVKDAKKRELVMDLIKNLTDERQADITASMGGVTAWAEPEYDAESVAPLYNEYLDLMKDKISVPIYDACMEASVIETMNTGLQSLLIGEKTPEDLAEEIQMEQDMVQ